VWPGQEMRWEVGEESGQPPATQDEKNWFTKLQLDLPTLGGISASLRFNGTAVAFEIEVGNAAATQTLLEASAQLVSALNARGVPVLQAQIRQAAESAE